MGQDVDLHPETTYLAEWSGGQVLVKGRLPREAQDIVKRWLNDGTSRVRVREASDDDIFTCQGHGVETIDATSIRS